MDTNTVIIAQFLDALNDAYSKNSLLQSQAVAAGSSLGPYIVQVATILGLIVGQILTYLKASKAEITGTENKESLGHITKLVNSRDSRNTEKTDRLEARVVELTSDNAVLNEQAKAASVTEQAKTEVARELSKP